ncbi:MAG: 2-amino-4-hydroxy-6-hydroxymethyldihydropteridine diphosphokinase [Xanthomonadales bacterium]|nr:2-amino-4-hydroxy-6-hydroxymethyldihydropteridine diphosphokinase [Xanthomonadales bacterium]
MAVVYLGLGSNTAPEAHLKIAIDWLQAEFSELVLSPAYRSTSVGFEGDDFINLVARIETELSPLSLKQRLTAFEDSNGRDRSTPRFSDRVIDIDILLYEQTISDDPKLILPREEILYYAHVLRPLAELVPELMHPRLGQTMREIWQAFDGNRSYLSPVEITGSK